MTLFGNDDSLSMPTSQIKTKEQITTQRITLEAILSLFESFKKTKIDNPIYVVIYVNDNILASELNSDTIEPRDKKYAKEISEIILLKDILSNKIKVTFKQSSIFSCVEKVK